MRGEGVAETLPGSTYRVAEISSVTDQEIERALNEWCGRGFRFDSIHFVVPPGSRRPSMAFLLFVPAGDPAAGTPA